MGTIWSKFQERLDFVRAMFWVMGGVLFLVGMFWMSAVNGPRADYEQKQFVYKTIDSVKYQLQIKDLQTKMDVITKNEAPAVTIGITSIMFIIFGIIISIILFVYCRIMAWRNRL
jgi:hypothetical protein